MSERYTALVRRLRDLVLGSAGVTDPSLRRAVEAHSAALGGRPGPSADGVPPALIDYVETVARHAYEVTDADVAALRRLGYSEEAIFELTVSAAVGAGLGRLERGLAAVRGER